MSRGVLHVFGGREQLRWKEKRVNRLICWFVNALNGPLTEHCSSGSFSGPDPCRFPAFHPPSCSTSFESVATHSPFPQKILTAALSPNKIFYFRIWLMSLQLYSLLSAHSCAVCCFISCKHAAISVQKCTNASNKFKLFAGICFTFFWRLYADCLLNFFHFHVIDFFSCGVVSKWKINNAEIGFVCRFNNLLGTALYHSALR